jgi:hydroxymethylglutaryl-CoA reductase (NADPH)
MVTIASDALSAYLAEQTGAVPVALAGNYDIDKKPAWMNVLGHRGTMVWAEVTLTRAALRDVLKTTSKKIFDVWFAKCMIGSAMSGSMAFNAQFANIVAALFAATGQDIAHVTEGSLGMTTAEVVGEDLYMSVYLPDLMVGTVGGGTGLATQKEALTLLGVAGGNDGKNAQKFAEIIGGAVLAGEISLLASLATGTLASSHKQLARGGK